MFFAPKKDSFFFLEQRVLISVHALAQNIWRFFGWKCRELVFNNDTVYSATTAGGALSLPFGITAGTARKPGKKKGWCWTKENKKKRPIIALRPAEQHVKMYTLVTPYQKKILRVQKQHTSCGGDGMGSTCVLASKSARWLASPVLRP